jgi:hypothetical protein
MTCSQCEHTRTRSEIDRRDQGMLFGDEGHDPEGPMQRE